MNIIKIYAENDIFQMILSLKQTREKRNRHKLFLFEGVRLINAALQTKWPLDAIIYSSQRPLSDWAKKIISDADTVYDMPLHLLEKLSDREEVSELLAIGKMQVDDITRVPILRDGLVAVFDRPTSPGNLGTFIRTCDAFGVNGIIITGHACDMYDPQTLRATTGSFFSLPIVRLQSHTEFLAWFEEARKIAPFQIVGTDEKAPLVINEVDFRKPTIILVGNETAGLSSAYKSLSTQLIKIPMSGSASSFNVAVAGSLILYEAKRQREFR